jgi:integrase
MRKLNRLSAQRVASLVRNPDAKRHADGGGLYLNLKAGGARWEFEFRRAGKKTPATMGLGSATTVSLATAREIADVARAQCAAGLNPIEERKKASERPTFGHFAEQMIAKKTAELHNPKSAAAWAMTLRQYAKPLYEKIAADVSTEDVLSILKPMWATKPETASRLQGRINAVLDAATAVGARATANPARWRGHLEHLLPKRKKLSRGHHAALPYAGVPRFMERLRLHDGVSARALEFLILTAARSGEVRGARWSEINTDDALWIVPAARMKARKEHRVPLSDAALELLRKMSPLKSAPDALVFPSIVPGRALSDMALTKLLDRMDVAATAHGFRSSFRDWAAEQTNFPHEVCEQALAHVIQNKAEAAYRRGDAIEKRRGLMAAWAEYCGGVAAANVVPFERLARA